MKAMLVDRARFVVNSETVLFFLLTSLLCLTALSSSLRSLVFPMTGIGLMVQKNTRTSILTMMKHPVSIALFLLFGWIILAFFWSPATWNQSFIIVGKYSKLLYIPLLAVGFQQAKTRMWALYAFLAAMLLTMVILMTNTWGFTHVTHKSHSGVFYNHIVTGAMFSLGAWLAFFLSFQKIGKEKYLLIGLGFLLSYAVLFVNTARTGYILYTVLMLILFKQMLSWKQAGMLALLFGVLIVICFQSSTVMHDGLYTIIDNLQQYGQAKKDTSVGYRIQFHLYATSLFSKHPIIGNGTGAFTWYYLMDNPLSTWQVRYFEPHSQYWLFSVEQGLIGLLLLGVVLGNLFRLACQLTQIGPLLIAFLATFILGCFSDSLLLFSPIGWLLVVVAAMCLGEWYERLEKNDHDDNKKLLYTGQASNTLKIN